MFFNLRIFALGVTLASAPTVSSGAIIYSYVTDLPAYDIRAGTSSVEVYLRETRTVGEPSLIASDGGLFGAGFSLTRTSGTDVEIGGFEPASEFSGILNIVPTLPTTAASFIVSAPVTFTSLAVPDPAGLIRLGRVTIVGTGTNGALFSLTAISGGGNTITYENAYDLDVASDAPAYAGAGTMTTSFTLVVPEPGTASLTGLSLILLGRRGRRLAKGF